MLASMRAELLILRKWPVAWALVLLTPLLTVLSMYVVQYVLYRTVTADQYSELGSPSDILPALLPGRLVVNALSYFGGGAGVAPFVILGALMAGGDWGRGTVKTALLQGPGRIATFAGQVLAMVLAWLSASW